MFLVRQLQLGDRYRWPDLFLIPGYPSYPTREVIYPSTRPLEQLLDQYFSLETATFFNEEMSEPDRGVEGPVNASYVNGRRCRKVFWPRSLLFDRSRIIPLNSWSPKHSTRGDRFGGPLSRSVGLTLNMKLNSCWRRRDQEIVSFGIKHIFHSDQAIRSKAVTGHLLTAGSLSMRGERYTPPVWNGMRRLPVRGDEIADAFDPVVHLQMLGVGREVTEAVEMTFVLPVFR